MSIAVATRNMVCTEVRLDSVRFSRSYKENLKENFSDILRIAKENTCNLKMHFKSKGKFIMINIPYDKLFTITEDDMRF